MENMEQKNARAAHVYERERTRGREPLRATARTRSSRSRSPRRGPPIQRFRQQTPETTSSLPACPTCLGREKHPIRFCRKEHLWNGNSKARCTRTNDCKLVDGAGRFLCINWNQSLGCKDTTARHIHECSGCGDKSHGAQQCSLAEKANSEHPSQG